MYNVIMSERPQIIKEFSKEQSANERDALAHEARAKRRDIFEARARVNDENGAANTRAEENESEVAWQLESLQELEEDIETSSDSLPDRIRNYFKLKNLRAELASGKCTYENLLAEKDKISRKQNDIKATSVSLSAEMAKIKTIIDDFYKQQETTWENSPYNREDITKYFNEDNLSKMSLQEYELLLKRFPSEVVTHVTRQGVRDHTGHMWHHGGLDKHSNGFVDIVKDGRIRSLQNS